jgi:hypothetical protein
MERRRFLRASIITGTVAGIAPYLSNASVNNDLQRKSKQEFYELREYTFTNAAQQQLVEDYFQKAAIPALNRLGSKHIGVFREQDAKGQPRLFVVVPFASLETFKNMRDLLQTDKAYQQAADAYLNATVKSPAYARIQSSLLRAFPSIPVMEVPEKKQRLFELRRYESHSELAHQKKIKMFGEGGEIETFRRVGLHPVFFGEALIGERLPNLTYMIVFEDMAEHDKNWKAFSADPEWVKIKDMPEYANTVTTITRTFLLPTEFSQI